MFCFCLLWYSNENKFWADLNKQKISRNKFRIFRLRIRRSILWTRSFIFVLLLFFFGKTVWLVKKIREKFMALSKSTFSVKMRGEIQRELLFIRKLSKFYFEGKRQAATSRLLADWGESHNGCFWEFLSKKYLRQISILGIND